MYRGSVAHVAAGRGVLRPDRFWKPLPCQARAPINAEGAAWAQVWNGSAKHGMASCVLFAAMPGDVGSVVEWLGTTLVQARGWINASGVG